MQTTVVRNLNLFKLPDGVNLICMKFALRCEQSKPWDKSLEAYVSDPLHEKVL